MKNKGFTLIEIMIVVAIVGILSAIAMPMYSAYLIRGKLVDAQTTLSTARVAMEQYYQDNRTYLSIGSKISPCPAATTYFTYTCAPQANSFMITASNAANQGLGTANSYAYTIDSSNAKSTTRFGGASASKSCWVTKAGQSC